MKRNVKDKEDNIKIVEKEENPTEWISPLTIVTKPNGDLGLCLDPRFLNEAIKREYFPIPAAEDIAVTLAHKKIFTVLDMKDGYLQVPLEKHSRKYS
ncbi:hypothetical protein Trydic_g16770 [Trypoxylus dichotomus]